MEGKRCEAIAITTGKRCKLKPVEGTEFCKRHTIKVPKSKAVKGRAKATKSKGVAKGRAKATKGRAKVDFAKFDILPKIAQIQILLNLDRATLKNACQTKKSINEICEQPEFRKRYLEKHPIDQKVNVKRFVEYVNRHYEDAMEAKIAKKKDYERKDFKTGYIVSLKVWNASKAEDVEILEAIDKLKKALKVLDVRINKIIVEEVDYHVYVYILFEKPKDGVEVDYDI
jgi:hypothetical protein